jgi:hypothetical protein
LFLTSAAHRSSLVIDELNGSAAAYELAPPS